MRYTRVNAFLHFGTNQNIRMMDERTILLLPLKQDCPENLESIRGFDSYICARRLFDE